MNYHIPRPYVVNHSSKGSKHGHYYAGWFDGPNSRAFEFATQADRDEWLLKARLYMTDVWPIVLRPWQAKEIWNKPEKQVS